MCSTDVMQFAMLVQPVILALSQEYNRRHHFHYEEIVNILTSLFDAKVIGNFITLRNRKQDHDEKNKLHKRLLYCI